MSNGRAPGSELIGVLSRHRTQSGNKWDKVRSGFITEKMDMCLLRGPVGGAGSEADRRVLELEGGKMANRGWQLRCHALPGSRGSCGGASGWRFGVVQLHKENAL